MKSASTELSSGLYKSGFPVCDDQLILDYRDTLHNFAKTKTCDSCHGGTNISRKAFADTDVDIAFDQFRSLGGLSIFDFYALNDHAAGISGEKNRGDLNLAKTAWDEARNDFNACVSSAVTGNISGARTTYEIATSLFDRSNAPLALGSIQNMQWDLNDSRFVPRLRGASFKIKVSVEEDANGDKVYHIKDPTLVTGANSINIENINVLINGTNDGKTTYSFALRLIPANSEVTLSTTTAVFKPTAGEFLKRSDRFSIQFQTLEVVD